jgi:hypothetical protein
MTTRRELIKRMAKQIAKRQFRTLSWKGGNAVRNEIHQLGYLMAPYHQFTHAEIRNAVPNVWFEVTNFNR